MSSLFSHSSERSRKFDKSLHKRRRYVIQRGGRYQKSIETVVWGVSKRTAAFRAAGRGGWWWKRGRGKVEYSDGTPRPFPTRGIPDKAVEHLLRSLQCTQLVRLPEVSSLKFTLSLWEPRNVGGISERSKLCTQEFEKLNRPSWEKNVKVRIIRTGRCLIISII